MSQNLLKAPAQHCSLRRLGSHFLLPGRVKRIHTKKGETELSQGEYEGATVVWTGLEGSLGTGRLRPRARGWGSECSVSRPCRACCSWYCPAGARRPAPSSVVCADQYLVVAE